MRTSVHQTLPVLSLFVSAALVTAQNDTAIAANLEHFWPYGRSPADYPTPEGSGSGSSGGDEAQIFAENPGGSDDKR